MEQQVTKPLNSFPQCISFPMKQAAVTTYWGLIEAGESNDDAVRHTHQIIGQILLNTPEEYWKQFEGIDFQDWERRHGRRPRPTPGFNSRRLH